MAKEIKIYNFDELSPEAQKVAIEKVRDDYYNSDRGQDFAEWATDDDYLFEPNHDEMVAIFGKDFKVVPNSKYGGEPMIGNTRKKLYWSLDRNRHIDADEAIEINNREMFLTWLGIPKEMQEKVYFKITDNGSRDADTIIEFEPNESDYEFTSEENKILTDAEKKFSDHMDSVLDRIEADIDYRHTDEAIREDIEANDHYQFFKSGKIARGFSSEDEMKQGGTMKNRFKTNPIESLSTRELAEKAGVTMFDVRKHNMSREDLIAMVSEGSYAKGGSVKSIASKFSGVASKYEGSAKEGYSVLVKDKNSDFSAWVDVWISGKDVQWDWNKYIFHTNNSKDVMQKSLQENIDIAEYASHIAIKTLEDKGLIHQDDKGEWSYGSKMANGGGVGKNAYKIYATYKKNGVDLGENWRTAIANTEEEAVENYKKLMSKIGYTDINIIKVESKYSNGGGVGEYKPYRIGKYMDDGRTMEYEYFDDFDKSYERFIEIRSEGESVWQEKLVNGDEYETISSYDPEEDEDDEMKHGGGLKQKSAQYGHKNYGVGDRQKHAKPVGYRYRKIRDPKTGRIRVVTKDDHQYYKSPSMKMIRDFEDGDKSARKMLYFEDRLDHSDKAPLRSLAKYAKGGSVTIDGKKAKYQVKYNLDGKEKIGYIVPIMTPSGHAIDIYYLYDKNKKLVKELRVAEANQLVKDKKIVNVKTYDVPMERLETDKEKSVKDMDYSERRNWIQDHIIPHLKSASLSWRDYQGGWYDYNDSKEEEKFLKDARTNADYKNEEDFNKNSGFKIAEDGWGISTKEGEDLEEVSSDNTYNWSYLGLVTWNIRIYQAGEEKFFLIAHPHKGGDVRGNYGDPIIFEDDSEESVMYKFREQVIDGNRVVSLEFKGGVNFTFDAEQDSDVDYFKLNDEPEKLKIGSPAEITLSTWKTFGSWKGDEFLTTIVDEFEKEHPKKKKKECGGDIEMRDGGSLQSLTTGQLATKAGMTMKEVHKFGYDRDDLIAMITEGNYRKGGGVGLGKEFENEEFEVLVFESGKGHNVIKEELSWDDAIKLAKDKSKTGKYYEVQVVSQHSDSSNPVRWSSNKQYSNGGGIGEPKISYSKYWSKHDGTFYDQKVKIDRATFEKLKDAVQSEIALKYPRKSEYVSTSGYEFYLKPLVIESNGVVELNHTQARFINLFLKLDLKDRNTRLYVVNKYENGGGVDGDVKERLEYLRGELRAERISQGELIELQSLAKHIDPSDVELLEAAGVPEGGYELNIDDEVFVNDKKGKIVAQLGRETNDPNEEAWYEVRFEDGSTDHFPISEIEVKYSKGGRLKQKREQYTADDRGIEKYGRRDNTVKARPIGYRYRKIRDKKTGKLRRVEKDDAAYYKTPSQSDIKAYQKGDKDARRRLYFENRKDHSDKNPRSNRGFRRGGEVSPEQMTVIINIQMMREKIFGSSYDKHDDFNNLKNMSYDELNDTQNALIPEYNKTFSK